MVWFGRNEQLKHEQLQQQKLLEQQAEAKRKLVQKIQHLLRNDPRFQVCTFDRMSWICPYTTRIVKAPFEYGEIAQTYLLRYRPWEQQPQPLTLQQLQIAAWRHYLQEALRNDERFRHVDGDLWLNPLTGKWLGPIPLDPDGSLGPDALQFLAEQLHQDPQSSQRDLSSSRAAISGIRSKSLVFLGGAVSVNHKAQEPEISIVADDEIQVMLSSLARTQVQEPTPKDVQTQAKAVPPATSENPIESAQQRDQRRARDVQSRLLGDRPEIPGLGVGLFFQAQETVSGDLYDCITLPDGRVLVIIGDVSGHGVQAGLIVQATIKSLRFICRACSDLKEIALRLNEEVLRDVLEDQFITAFLAVLDQQTLQMDCLWLGHHPLVVARLSASSYLNEVSQKSAALGLLRTPLFASTLHVMQLNLEAGDVLFQYTDGASEAMSPQHEPYGESRLFASFVHHLLEKDQVDAQVLADAMANDVIAWSQKTLSDDLTLIVLAVSEAFGSTDDEPLRSS